MSLEHESEVRLRVQECMELIKQFESMNLYAPDLLRIETSLAAKFTFLLSKKARYQFEQNTAYWIRKIEHSREAIKARNSTGVSSQKTADHLANLTGKEEIDAENYSVWRYEHLKGFCRGLEKVLITIAHRLKDLSSERIASNKQQG